MNRRGSRYECYPARHGFNGASGRPICSYGHPVWPSKLLLSFMLSCQEFVIIGLCRSVIYDSFYPQGGQPGLCDPHPRVFIHPCDRRPFLMRWVKNSGSRRRNQLCTRARCRTLGVEKWPEARLWGLCGGTVLQCSGVGRNHIRFRLSFRSSRSSLSSEPGVSGSYYIRMRRREVQEAHRQSHEHTVVCREQGGDVCGLGRKGGQPSLQSLNVSSRHQGVTLVWGEGKERGAGSCLP